MTSPGQPITGAVVSSVVKVAVVELKFPQASVAVKVTVSDPLAPQASLRPMLSLVQVTPEHPSEASAPPLSANQAVNASVVPSHSTVLSDAATSIVGSVVSTIVKVASRVKALLLESVRVKVTVSVPVAPQSSLKSVLLVVMVTEPQLSIPEKVLFNQLLNSVVFPEPSQATVKSLGGITQVGFSVSFTVTSKLQVVVFPISSTAVVVTVVTPTGNVSPDEEEVVTTKPPLPPKLILSTQNPSCGPQQLSIVSYINRTLVFAVPFAGEILKLVLCIVDGLFGSWLPITVVQDAPVSYTHLTLPTTERV